MHSYMRNEMHSAQCMPVGGPVKHRISQPRICVTVYLPITNGSVVAVTYRNCDAITSAYRPLQIQNCIALLLQFSQRKIILPSSPIFHKQLCISLDAPDLFLFLHLSRMGDRDRRGSAS